MPTLLVAFYAGTAPDTFGRTLDEIHAWSVDLLESTHDYIQWMFPLRAPSAFAESAPLLDDEQIALFRNSEQLRARLLKSLDVMLRFYGFHRDGLSVVRSNSWKERSKNWLTKGNHNHLRLTRMLTSLSILGLEAEALALQAALLAECTGPSSAISHVTKEFWERAIQSP